MPYKIEEVIAGEKPEAGIVVPTYNRREQACRTIDSLLFQDTDVRYLIVVVDDGSIDRTFEHIHEKYKDQINSSVDLISGEHFSRNPEGKIITLRQRNNHVSAARNTGLRGLNKLDCEYYSHQDSGDIALPNKISSLLGYLEFRYDVDYVHAKAHDLDAEGKILIDGPYQRYFRPLWERARKGLIEKGDIKTKNHIHNQTVFFKRNVIDTLGTQNLFWEGQNRGNDWDFHIKVENAGLNIGFCDEYVAMATVNEGGITSEANEKRKPEDIAKEATRTEDLVKRFSMFSLAINKAGGEREFLSRNPATWDCYFNTIFTLGYKRNVAMNLGDISNAYVLADALCKLNPSEENTAILSQLNQQRLRGY